MKPGSQKRSSVTWQRSSPMKKNDYMPALGDQTSRLSCCVIECTRHSASCSPKKPTIQRANLPFSTWPGRGRPLRTKTTRTAEPRWSTRHPSPASKSPNSNRRRRRGRPPQLMRNKLPLCDLTYCGDNWRTVLCQSSPEWRGPMPCSTS